MQRQTGYVIAGVAVSALFLLLAPWWVSLLILLAVIGIPVGGYALLDASQKRRLKNLARKQIGRG